MNYSRKPEQSTVNSGDLASYVGQISRRNPAEIWADKFGDTGLYQVSVYQDARTEVQLEKQESGVTTKRDLIKRCDLGDAVDKICKENDGVDELRVVQVDEKSDEYVILVNE
tara:strand:+ start:305 stop:640 length:336 start_codon:yes stop_codon:yes gene_type:complete